MTRSANSECPPSSKKSSWRPTRSRCRNSAQIAAMAVSMGPGADRRLACQRRGPRERERRAVQFAVRGKRKGAETHIGCGNHVFGQRRSRWARKAVAAISSSLGEVGDEALLARDVLAGEHDRLTHRWMRGQRQFDFAQLDAETANLHLMVQTAQKLDGAARPGAEPGPRSCKAAPRLAAERVGDELLRASTGADAK